MDFVHHLVFQTAPSFRNVFCSEYRMIKKFQEPNNTNCNTSLSEPSRIYSPIYCMLISYCIMLIKVGIATSTGGLLGLFNGFSFISTVEILYFGTV